MNVVWSVRSQFGKKSFDIMEGLKERNANVIRTHKRHEKAKPLVVASHASMHARSAMDKLDEDLASSKATTKVGLDDEEMLFLARRCLADELMSRPAVAAAVLSEQQAVQAVAASNTQVVVSLNQAPEMTEVVQPVAVVPMRNRTFHLHRLGFGLVVLKFGWIWVSCGGLIMADSVFCTSDIFSIVFKRLAQHLYKVGGRVHAATRLSAALFREGPDQVI